jgi:hypothetical protein
LFITLGRGITLAEEKDNQKVIEKQQQTNTGIICSGGEITLNEFDDMPWEQQQKDYTNMMKDTPSISSSLNLMFFPMEAAKFRIDLGPSKSEKAKEARDYINNCWDHIDKGFTYNIRHKLLALPLGLSLQEKVIKNADEYKFLKDGKFKKKITNRIIKYSPIQNSTIFKTHYDNDRFIGITQTKNINNAEGLQTIEYPKIYEGQNKIKNIKDVLSVYTYRELFNDVRGQSLLRPARLYAECLKKVVIGKAINIQRGAGLVGIKFTNGFVPSAGDKAAAARLGRGLNNLNGDNFYYHTDNMEVILNEIKGQNEAMAFIEFLFKQILLTLLTEFISIGMGQVGAYNAGETQKSPYELAINNTLEDMKRHYQEETNYMLEISYLSGLTEEDKPIFEFDAPNQLDMIKITQTLLNLKNMGVVFTPEEMNIIKSLLPFLPEVNIKTEQTTLSPEGQEDVKANIEMKSGKIRKVKPEILEFEAATFEKNSAEEHYLTIEEKANDVILKKLKEILKESKNQVTSGLQRVHIDNWHRKDLEAKITKLFEEGYNRGSNDVKKEVKKVQAYKQLKIKMDCLELARSIPKKQAGILSLTITKMFDAIKNTIEYDMTSMSEKQLTGQGGLDGYFETLINQFNGVKRDMINDVTSGYTTGRNDKIEEISTDETELLCSEIMDVNLCGKCSQDDGLTFTVKEIKDSDYLSMSGSSIHLNCEGYDYGKRPHKCRGQWVVYG